jgi:hypothetical protein
MNLKEEIKSLIVELEKPYPADNLISSYKDFLAVRDNLKFYQVNINVLNSLLDLTVELWHTKKRISRLSLYENIKKYLFTISDYKKVSTPQIKVSNLSDEIIEKLFLLFKNSFSPPDGFSSTQTSQVQRLSNSMLIGMKLSVDAQKWLCYNVSKSELIKNRLLRYPAKSDTISKWAKENFFSNLVRNRRPEITSWIIDENPEFEIEKETLIDDFEYLNNQDKDAIKAFEDEMEAVMAIERDLTNILPKSNTKYLGYTDDLHTITPLPELKLQRRFYPTIIDTSKNYPDVTTDIPDFEMMRKYFYKELAEHFKRTMLWAIAYSRLENSEKSRLLPQYYCKQTHNTYLNICRKYKLVEALDFLNS